MHITIRKPVVAVFTLASIICSANATLCRTLPTDRDWPSKSAWDDLNTAVNGRLIETIPIGSVCHDPTYDEAACQALRSEWRDGNTHIESSSSTLNQFFANRSCDPFTDRSLPCNVGTYISYAVNISSAADIAATIKFAEENNIRFVIRNTGHDQLGRSTGQGALAAWTHHMKDAEVVDWSNDGYVGPALKVGAGIQGGEAVEFAASHGLVIVGGGCPTVGFAGGYVQGSGHSPIDSTYGMAADQTLEFEVVTASGEIVVANARENADLYWALSGGGPGSYGVVTSVTVRAYPDATTSGATIFINTTTVPEDEAYGIIESYYAALPRWTDARLHGGFAMSSSYFTMTVTAYNQTSEQVNATIKPFLNVVDEFNVTYTLNFGQEDRYYDQWTARDSNAIGTHWGTGGRLIPRATLEKPSNLQSLMGVVRSQISEGAIVGGTFLNGTSRTGVPNAVNPAWRETTVLSLTLTDWDFSATDDAWADMLHNSKRATEVWDPMWDAVTPGAGNYANEADFAKPNWKEAFYGAHYDRLLAIKQKWDPKGMFYGNRNVGSDQWSVNGEGRLCRSAVRQDGQAINSGR
ncbi:FAD binding domain-containing protein [Colletotrichum salicis]|uniref:FAD binding domain-containing protein n=1 Tax=Colletotrichum salicis TaxID=1209931 RepID=A0A135UAQ6_9PEZI|nr:FAD binding domain-containing protein [Colletotrichum salicis]